MSAPRGTEWTPAEIARVQTLWDEEGLSASQIGKLLGRSRNAVISKVRRMAFAERVSAVGGKPRKAADHRLVPLTSATAKAIVKQFQVEDLRTFTARFCGDPLPGRSALDKLVIGERNKNGDRPGKSGFLLAPQKSEVSMEDRLLFGKAV